MFKHVVVLAWIHLMVGVGSLLGGLFIGSLAWVDIAPEGLMTDQQLFQLQPMLRVLAVLSGLTGVVELFVGRGLLRFSPLARKVALVMGALNLPNAPLGTAMGVYTIWVLRSPGGRQRFLPRRQIFTDSGRILRAEVPKDEPPETKTCLLLALGTLALSTALTALTVLLGGQIAAAIRWLSGG